MRLPENEIVKKYHAAISEMKQHTGGVSPREAGSICERLGVNNAILTMLKKMNETLSTPNGFLIKRNDVENLAKECRKFTKEYSRTAYKLRLEKKTPIQKTAFPFSDMFLINKLKERGYSISRTETINY